MTMKSNEQNCSPLLFFPHLLSRLFDTFIVDLSIKDFSKPYLKLNRRTQRMFDISLIIVYFTHQSYNRSLVIIEKNSNLQNDCVRNN